MARRVAAKLEVPFYVVDAKQVFRKTVVGYFLDGYAQGGTPNPCLACNRHIRWEFLLNHALAMDAGYMATGHYVRVRDADAGQRQLLRGADPAKDQSYVLSVLTQEQLKRALFPVGEYSKEEIRELAREFDLPTASRQDSQDLCFLAGEDYRVFLSSNLPEIAKSGDILARDGQVLGQHKGLAFYTIGQRKGLGVSSPHPLYVLEKDLVRNALIVGSAEELGGRTLLASDVNWVSGEAPRDPFSALVKIRYTARPASAQVTPFEGGEGVQVRFEAPQRDITPGQAAVFYEGDLVLGGGVIQA
jgi:tRNA-specific 2-thiouridylase